MPTQVQGLGLVDDQGNKSIVVNLSNARQMTNAEYQQLTPAQRNGAIIVTDYPIPEESDSVTVHADGTKTWGQLLDELYDAIDKSKVVSGSAFVLTNSDNTIFTPIYNNPVGSTFEGLYFVHIEATTYAISANLKLSGSSYATAQSGVVTDISSETATRDFTFHYGTSSEIMNLLTDADHCMMSNGQSVENAIDKLTDNEMSTYIDITTYTSKSNMYQAPSDGYILIRNNTGVIGKGVLYGSNKVTVITIGKGQGDFLCFVKKGMYMFCANSPTEAYFILLS